LWRCVYRSSTLWWGIIACPDCVFYSLYFCLRSKKFDLTKMSVNFVFKEIVTIKVLPFSNLLILHRTIQGDATREDAAFCLSSGNNPSAMQMPR
jgi:hypothetical protein